MASLVTSPTLPDEATDWSLAELRKHLDGVPLHRIRLNPPPGQATEDDVFRVRDTTGRLCELIDGTLVEKTMGWYESRLALILGYFIETFLETHDLGMVLTTDGPFRLQIGRLRMPDVSFLSWDHFPGRELPDDQVLRIAPDLAVEILSKSNTRREMQRKLEEYFAAGTKLVWYIDPKKRTARVFTAIDQVRELTLDDELDGGDVLPGFRLSMRQLFDRAARRGESSNDDE